MTEPLHITAVLIALADLRNDLELPHPTGLRMTKCNGIATVEVATFGDVMAWADAFGVSHDARHSSTFKSGASAHSAWAEWNGWHVRIAAYVDAPALAVDYLPEPVSAGCSGHSAADDCPNHVLRAPDRTIFSHCNWIGDCDTELTDADGSMLCPVHAAAPLEDAMGHYERELQGGAR